MVWLGLPIVVIALVVVHELAVYAIARRLGGEPHRRVAIVIAAAVAYVAVCALAAAFYVDHRA